MEIGVVFQLKQEKTPIYIRLYDILIGIYPMIVSGQEKMQRFKENEGNDKIYPYNLTTDRPGKWQKSKDKACDCFYMHITGWVSGRESTNKVDDWEWLMQSRQK